MVPVATEYQETRWRKALMEQRKQVMVLKMMSLLELFPSSDFFGPMAVKQPRGFFLEKN